MVELGNKFDKLFLHSNFKYMFLWDLLKLVPKQFLITFSLIYHDPLPDHNYVLEGRYLS